MIKRRVAVAVLLGFAAISSAEGQATPEPPSTPATPVPRRPATAPRAPGVPATTAAPGVPAATAAPGAAMAPIPPAPPLPEGWFGFSMRCSECGWSRRESEDTPRWRSSTLPEIGIVAPGSPAAVAGLKPGDFITHIDGASILTPVGARRFGAVRPGQRVRLSVTRNGTALTRELTLAERPRPMSGRSTLRYAGRLRTVDVEVWSPAGATVERDGDTITINVAGSTIRLKATTPITPPPGR